MDEDQVDGDGAGAPVIKVIGGRRWRSVLCG